MAPIQGWYPDPAGSGQLRYFDGQNWTSSTGPLPHVTAPAPPPPAPAMAMSGPAMGTAYGSPSAPFETPPPVYGPPNQPYGMAGGYGAPGSAAPPWGPRPSRFTNRWKITIAGVVAVGIAAAITVPSAFGSHESALTKAFERSLLTPETISSLTNETFTIDTSKDDSSDSSSSGCMDAANKLSNSGNDRGEASRSFGAADHSTYIAEDLSNDSSNPEQMNALKDSLSKCSSTTIDGATMNIQAVAAPQIAGASDTMAMRMSGEVNGNPLTFIFTVARFGDNVVAIMSGGISLQTLSDSLLTEAVQEARPAFPKS